MSENDVLKTAIHDFKRSVEITRDVRFQANLRLAGRQRGSSYIVSLLSLYVIALSLIPNVVELHQFQTQLLLACSIILSVFVIFTSLIDGAQNFYHQGELLHQCARKIATVHHGLKDLDVEGDLAKAESEFKRLQVDYAKALDDCPINHGNVDFYAEIARKPHLFSMQYANRHKFIVKTWYRTKSFILGLSWVIPHFTAFIIVTIIIYFFVIANASPVGTNLQVPSR